MPRFQFPRLLPVAALAFLPILISGCHGGNNSSNPPSDNIFRVAMTAEPTTLDPALVQDGPTIDLLQQIYEGLVMWTPQNTLAPALATSWDVSPNHLTYTFHLRQGVKFQSGAAMDANAVAYSFTRTLSPEIESPVALTYMGDIAGAKDFASGKAKTISGIRVIDANTIAITISKPKAYWLNVLTYPTAYVVNPAVVNKDPKEQINEFNTDGTGPFSLKSYTSGTAVDLASNPGYWGGAPKIMGQHRPILTDANTRHSEYLAGQLDLVDETGGDIDADSQNSALKDQIHFWPRAATYYVSFGEIAQPIFRNKLVRQAFAYATDKNRIVQTVFGGNRDAAQDILPEGIPGWSKDFQGIPYDPTKAKALMAQAGYPGGKGFPTLPMSYRESNPDLAKTVDLLREMYGQVLGVTIQPRQTEWSTLLDQEDHKALPIYHMRWSADYLDPQDFYSLLYHSGADQNNTGYNNPEFNKICDQADSDQNPIERAALYRKAARILADDVPMLPLYYQRDPELVKPYVHGLDDSLMGHLPYKHLSMQ